MYQPNEGELSTILAALWLWQRFGAVLDAREIVVDWYCRSDFAGTVP